VEGYIWRYAKRIGANIFFRGIRSWEKDGRDERNLQIRKYSGVLCSCNTACPFLIENLFCVYLLAKLIDCWLLLVVCLSVNTWGPLVFGPLAIPIPTIYIEGDPKYNHVSSTLIRKICSGSSSNNKKDGGDEQIRNTEAALSELVPSGVAGKVANLYGANE